MNTTTHTITVKATASHSTTTIEPSEQVVADEAHVVITWPSARFGLAQSFEMISMLATTAANELAQGDWDIEDIEGNGTDADDDGRPTDETEVTVFLIRK